MIAALIVAAGRGERMGAERAKQFLPLGDRPVLAHSVQAFAGHHEVDQVCLVVGREDLDHCRDRVLAGMALEKPLTLVAGGEERQVSVGHGLNAMAAIFGQGAGAPAGIVLIHDGVRPFVHPDLISACIQGARRWKACIPALPASETVKQVDSRGFVRDTLDRRSIYLVQTPQAFEFELIRAAHAAAGRNGWQVTDDAALLERMGTPVQVIQGRRENIKITVPEDLDWAQRWLGYPQPERR